MQRLFINYAAGLYVGMMGVGNGGGGPAMCWRNQPRGPAAPAPGPLALATTSWGCWRMVPAPCEIRGGWRW